MHFIIKQIDSEFQTVSIHFLLKSLNRLEVLSQICPKILPKLSLDQKPNLQSELFYAIMKALSPKRDSIVPHILWNSRNVIHTKFEPVFTNEGICFTFNSFNSREVYTDELVEKSNGKELSLFVSFILTIALRQSC